MSYLYKKKRIETSLLEIGPEFENINIENPSLLILAKCINFEETLVERLKTRIWMEIVVDLFITVITNLVITKKIEFLYCHEKKIFLFDLININSEFFIIELLEDSKNIHSQDVLENNIIVDLTENAQISTKKLSVTIKNIFDLYIGGLSYQRPEREFFYRYIKTCSTKKNWLKLNETKSFLGLLINFNVEINAVKRNELKVSLEKYNRIKEELIATNVTFKKLIYYIKNTVCSELESRRSSSD